MHSQLSQASARGRAGAEPQQFKGMRFCSECDNMLDAKEHKSEDQCYLKFECKLCNNYTTAAEHSEIDNCVYRTDFTMRAENLQVDPECVKDPTLQRRQDVECKHCGHHEAVCFTQPTKDRMTLIFVCTNCKKYWTKGEGERDDQEEFSSDSDQ